MNESEGIKRFASVHEVPHQDEQQELTPESIEKGERAAEKIISLQSKYQNGGEYMGTDPLMYEASELLHGDPGAQLVCDRQLHEARQSDPDWVKPSERVSMAT